MKYFFEILAFSGIILEISFYFAIMIFGCNSAFQTTLYLLILFLRRVYNG